MSEHTENNLPVRGMDSTGNYVYLPYDPKAPTSEKGRRTIAVLYKVAKTGKNAGIKKGNNVCLLVPPLSISEIENNIDKLMPHVLAMCEVEQNKIAKTLHISGGDDVLVSPTEISIDSIIRSLEAERVSTRLNKETVQSWFDTELADSLTILFADKLGLSDSLTQNEEDKLNSLVGVYKTKFSNLASNVVTYQPAEAEKLMIAMDKCDIDMKNDIIAAKLGEKLDKMINPSLDALMDL